jgi:ribosomal protein S12 methylthiotransferase
MKVNLITLGCSKNTVDSEYLLRQLEYSGFKVYHDRDDIHADTVIINTCGFINDAREESVNTILQYAQARQRGEVANLFVFGCLSERYQHELRKEIPEVDDFFGVNNLQEIVEKLGGQYRKELLGERMITTPSHYAFLKISEGCDRNCAYCSIPLIRGKHQSRPFEDILKEAEKLAENGVKELLVIAQDISYYGLDLYHKQRLPELIDELAAIRGFNWIRLHYAYPHNFPLSLINVMNRHDNICNYLDIPLQHISNKVLGLMRRGNTRQQTYELIKILRKEIPGIALRTTFLTGHPGETEEEFARLYQFVEEMRFERMGVFTYSEEEGTYAANNYKDEIPEEIKQERAEKLMELQQQISLEYNKKLIGKVLPVIIDRREGDFMVGRTEFDSPEVDNEVLIQSEGETIEPGKFYQIQITAAEEYDLYGKKVSG